MHTQIHITGASGQIISFVVGLTDALFPIEADSNEALRRHLNAGGTWESFDALQK